MSFALLAFAFGFGLLVGGPMLVILRRTRPGMDAIKRRLFAAATAPFIVAGLCFLALIPIIMDGRQANDDLASATLLAVAVVAGGVAFAGGLLGTWLMERRVRK